MTRQSEKRLGIHDIVRELNGALGPTLVATLVGTNDLRLPVRWAKADGPEPRADASRRLTFAHRQWSVLAAAEGKHVARQWFIGSNPLLAEDTPLTAIREDRHTAVASAVKSFVDGHHGGD